MLSCQIHNHCSVAGWLYPSSCSTSVGASHGLCSTIGGHPIARHHLGCHEGRSSNVDRGVKHWIIAATQGDDDSMKVLMDAFKRGFFNKEELAATPRAHHAAVDAPKCPQREAAEEFLRILDEK